MSLLSTLAQRLEAVPAPDPLTRAVIGRFVDGTRRRLDHVPGDAESAFAQAMRERPVAEHVEAANDQHYELPADFFGLVLGPRRKYSCGFYDGPDSTLANAEARALALTAETAQLADGQSVLELGCGWGSLSLWMAEQFPASSITAVSNSRSQRRHIDAQALRRGLTNLTVITEDMNHFAPEGRFDRVVSVEMFEHIANWPGLLARVRDWLNPDGRLFVHVFTHRSAPYSFDVEDDGDWIAQHFFTGGVMPSHGLIGRFPELFEVEAQTRWSGAHYQRTALDWLANYDANMDLIHPLLVEVYGKAAGLWKRRWRLFFLATAGLFGCRGGEVWGVSHYRLKPVRAAGLAAAE